MGPPMVSMLLRPKDNDIAVVTVPGGAEGVVVTGSIVTVTFVAAASTPVSLQAVVAADPVAKLLLSIDGPATAIPATYPGGTYPLFTRRPIPPVLMNIVDGDGNVVPFSGKSISIAVTVPADRDNTYKCLAVDLGVARAAPGLLFLFAGRNLSIVSTDGNFILKFNTNASDAIPQTPSDHGSFENTEFTRFYIENLAQPGKTAHIYIGQKV
jgi:hypothetical protein